MLTEEKNELLTRVGPGTPMGETLRRYWLPGLLSWEIPEPDCPPVRVKLLGERLVAFRDTMGRIGLIEEACAHRGASLFLARNEECGLRCIYHGWKYDVEGNCVDQMNEPPELNFKSKIRLAAYPTVELGGVIWAYMGPPEKMPPPPKFEWTQAVEGCRHVTKVWQECNWLQGLEGGIDNSHASILHSNLTSNTRQGGLHPTLPQLRSKSPTLVVETTDYGFRYFAVRPMKNEDEGTYVRSYHYVMPFHQFRPSEVVDSGKLPGHIWVPMDDYNCMVFNWLYSIQGEQLSEDDILDKTMSGGTRGNGPLDVDQKTFRSFRNKDNDYLQDRQVQKTESFSGIDGINAQDRAVQESMGLIVDRSKEHLGPADAAIIKARQILLDAVAIVQDDGSPPGTGTSYYPARAIAKVLPRDTDWHEALLPQMYAGVTT